MGKTKTYIMQVAQTLRRLRSLLKEVNHTEGTHDTNHCRSKRFYLLTLLTQRGKASNHTQSFVDYEISHKSKFIDSFDLVAWSLDVHARLTSV